MLEWRVIDEWVPMRLPLQFTISSNLITDVHLFFFFLLKIYLYFHAGKEKKGEKTGTIFLVLSHHGIYYWQVKSIKIQNEKNESEWKGFIKHLFMVYVFKNTLWHLHKMHNSYFIDQRKEVWVFLLTLILSSLFPFSHESLLGIWSYLFIFSLLK